MSCNYISMLHDAEFFHSRISKLDGAADLGTYLIQIINEKTVATVPLEKPSTLNSPNVNSTEGTEE